MLELLTRIFHLETPLTFHFYGIKIKCHITIIYSGQASIVAQIRRFQELGSSE